MKWRLVIFQVAVVALLMGLYLATKQSQMATTAAERENEPLVRNLPLDRIASVEISKGDERAVLKREDAATKKSSAEEAWLLASAWDSPVDGEKLKEFVDEIRTLKRGQFRGGNPKLLKDYGLDEKERTTVIFRDAKEKSVASVILGKSTFSMADFAAMQQGTKGESTSTTYVLLPGTTNVHEIPGSHSVSASRTFWADLKIVDMEIDEISLVQFQSEKSQFALVRRIKEGAPDKEEPPKEGEPPDKQKEKKKEYEWLIHLGRGREAFPADETKVRSLLGTLAHLRAADVAEPMKIPAGAEEPDTEEMARYGFDKEKLFVGICTPREGNGQPVLRHLLQFAKASDKEEHYVHSPQRRTGFEVLFSALADNPDQFVEKVRVYKVGKWNYDSVNKIAADFEKAPEKEPEGPPVPRDETPQEKTPDTPQDKQPEAPPEDRPETPPETRPQDKPDTPPDTPPEKPPEDKPQTPPDSSSETPDDG
jgi:hypothetical protein